MTRIRSEQLRISEYTIDPDLSYIEVGTIWAVTSNRFSQLGGGSMMMGLLTLKGNTKIKMLTSSGTIFLN